MLKHAGFPPDEECGAEMESIRLVHCQKGGIASVSPSKKFSSKTDVADEIGRGLRNIYNDVLSQPVPDRFFDLLKQLERSPNRRRTLRDS